MKMVGSDTPRLRAAGASPRTAARPLGPLRSTDTSARDRPSRLTGDEAEQATIAAVDAAVLAEQPYLRIIHGMGTGVVRERVRRVVSGDRGSRASASRRAIRAEPVSPSWSSPREHDSRRDVDQVRESADLVGIIGEPVELKRTGSGLSRACPFHGGTHRNFAVIPKKGRYYCFVCHESGDVFSWLMKRFGMDYPTAVRDARAARGSSFPRRRPLGPDPREPLFEAVAVGAGLVHPAAARVGRRQGTPGLPRRAGVTLETAARSRAGFRAQGRAS
jgi:hypothetical protein